MVSPITTQPKTTKTSIFYVNDAHAQIANMERLKTAADKFSLSNEGENIDKLKLSSGDFNLSRGPAINRLAIAIQNSMGISASACGNHEFDLSKKDFIDVFQNNNYQLLGLNIDIPETTDENKKIKTEISSSFIQEQNGNKYGIIGIFPPDFFAHITDPKEYEDFRILSTEETIKKLQEEINNLKNKNVNKIILLSHAGYNEDLKIAQSVEGIDIILGGHSHELIEGIQEGKNLFYSKKTGEPTIITQAGKNGKYFGVLNIEFNENGIITKAQNNINKTEDFSRSPIIKYLTNLFLGKPEIVGRINSVEKYKLSILNENPNANFINDAVRNELNVDISIINPGNIRANFEEGDLTDRDLSNLTPFKNNMCTFKLTEKELIDAIKYGAQTLKSEGKGSGLIQLSGIRYSVTKSGEVKEINFVDKKGDIIPIDINNPNPFKIYTAATDIFVAKGGNGYLQNKWDTADKKFDFDKDKLVIDYLKNIKKPVDIKTDGRIKIVD